MSTKVENLSVKEVIKILECWDLSDYVDFVRENNINGIKLLNVSEEILKHANLPPEQFMIFIQNLKDNNSKYISCLNNNVIKIKETNLCRESQYQTVSVRKVQDNTKTVEEIIKRITIPKSFLYRNQQKKPEKNSYVLMDSNKTKPKRFFRLSSYEYPIFDIKSRFSKPENFADRGYYSIKTNNRFYIQKTYRKPDMKSKYKSLPPTEELSDKLAEDHLYEDLCYTDVPDGNIEQTAQAKPRIVKIQELFQSFKFPFFRKSNVIVEDDVKEKEVCKNKDETTDAMYDSIHVAAESEPRANITQTSLVVEDYLEPVQIERDYCDIGLKNKEESLLSFIMSYLESRFGTRKETNDAAQSEESETDAACDVENAKWDRKSNMAARPLPVPVENEPYYMNIDRTEAENLLLGHPDGTFILRPSSQPNHAYTLSVSCGNSVHNVGVRRRPDGKLALGFARRGERSFTCITSLLRHHRKRRLLLVAGGDLIGATTLTDTPQYYQTPRSLAMPSYNQ